MFYLKKQTCLLKEGPKFSVVTVLELTIYSLLAKFSLFLHTLSAKNVYYVLGCMQSI